MFFCDINSVRYIFNVMREAEVNIKVYALKYPLLLFFNKVTLVKFVRNLNDLQMLRGT